MCTTHRFSLSCTQRPPKVTFDIEYRTASGAAQSICYARLAILSSTSISDLRAEIRRRSGHEDFALAARLGLEGIEFALHSDDTVNEVIRAGESGFELNYN